MLNTFFFLKIINEKKNLNKLKILLTPHFFNDSVWCFSCKIVAFRDCVGFAREVLWEWGKL